MLFRSVKAEDIENKIAADSTFNTDGKMIFVPLDDVYFASDAELEGINFE